MRRAATATSAVGLGVAAYGALYAAAPHVPAIAALLRVPTRLPHRGGIAITFDDGPHPDGTPAVLEALDAAGARATFFLVGEQVERWPRAVAETAAAGHEIGVHGYRHRLLLRRTPRAVEADLDRAWNVIAAATGRAPVAYRPPYGVFSPAALRVARERGWQPLLWSRWGRDWERSATPAGVAARAGDAVAPGDVVLLHDADFYGAPGSWRVTAAALPSVLEAVAATGAPTVSVSHST